MNGSFRVGEWLVEPQLNTLTGGEKATHVEPKIMQVLVCLAEHAGEVVSKECLLKSVWADTFVTEDVLTYSISELRKALGDDAKQPHFIQTIPRNGYRLIAPVCNDGGGKDDSFLSPYIPPPPEIVTRRRRPPIAMLALSFVAIGLAIAVVILWLSNRELRRKEIKSDTSKDPAAYGVLWAPFMEGPPPLVILSNPPTLRQLIPNEPEIVGEGAITLSPEAMNRLKEKVVTNAKVAVKESSGAPGNADAPEGKIVQRQVQSPKFVFSNDTYTGVGEAIGVHYLTDLFRAADRSILVKQSRTLSAEDLKDHNVILLGGALANEWSGKLAEAEDFIYTNQATIRNRNPQPGEEAEYISQFNGRTGSLILDYALITVKAGISDENLVMTLAGIHSQGTGAAVEFVTKRNYLRQLNQRLQEISQQGDSPPHFQVLLKVGVENGIPSTISILSLHELRAPAR